MQKLTITISIIVLFLLGVFIWEHTPRYLVEESIEKKEILYGFSGKNYDLRPIFPMGYKYCDEKTISQEKYYETGLNRPTTTINLSFIYCYKKSGHWVWPKWGLSIGLYKNNYK